MSADTAIPLLERGILSDNTMVIDLLNAALDVLWLAV